jgi:hypothetical protein
MTSGWRSGLGNVAVSSGFRRLELGAFTAAVLPGSLRNISRNDRCVQRLGAPTRDGDP